MGLSSDWRSENFLKRSYRYFCQETNMLIEHQGKRPTIHPTAYIAPSAVISGDVEIGAESRILHGAIITSEGAPISIGKHCIVMEHAVIRGAGGKTRSFPVSIGDETLIGPHSYLVGCRIDSLCFIATGAVIFNQAHLQMECQVTVGGIVHANTILQPAQVVPLQHVAIGNPATILSPADTEAMMKALATLDFGRTVFGTNLNEKSVPEIIEAVTRERRNYAQALAQHLRDVLLDPENVN
jgi:carbonic anhydrase/acetyltransferase-like protein (isoleucine patch superfamily)